MFTVEIVANIGQPVQIVSATQVVIRTANGTPVCLAAVFGGSNGLLVTHCNDPTFQANLVKAGISDTVITEKVTI